MVRQRNALGTKDDSALLEEIRHKPVLDSLVDTRELDVNFQSDILEVCISRSSSFLCVIASCVGVSFIANTIEREEWRRTDDHVLRSYAKSNVAQLLD